MTVFVPIRGTAGLPVVGAPDAVEGHTLDFKEWHDGITFRELEVAKDVAAFANASGGVLIYGATAIAMRLAKYEGKSPVEAEAWCKRVDELVRERCSPPPIIEPRVVVSPDGSSSLVVVNVNPAGGQAVGVRVLAKTDEWIEPVTGDSARSAKGVDAYIFPIRAGEGTRWLNPEQVAMLMIPRLRRAISLLRQIAPNEEIHIDSLSTEEVWVRGPRYFDSVNELENALIVRSRSIHGAIERYPLDAVCSVWRATIGPDFRWRVYIDLRATAR